MTKSRLAYKDCYAAMDSALESKEGVWMLCDSHGDAYHQRQRLNYARELDRQDNATMYHPAEPLHGRSHYDNLTFKLSTYQDKDCVLLQPNNPEGRQLIDVATGDAITPRSDSISGAEYQATLIGHDSMPLLPSTHEDIFPPSEAENGDGEGQDVPSPDEGGGRGVDAGTTHKGGLRRL